MLQNASSNAGNNGGGLQKIIALLGSALGIVAAIVATPPFFNMTRGPLLAFLADNWGHGVGVLLLWVIGACQFVVIWMVVRLVLTLVITFGTAALAALGFPGMRA